MFSKNNESDDPGSALNGSMGKDNGCQTACKEVTDEECERRSMAACVHLDNADSVELSVNVKYQIGELNNLDNISHCSQTGLQKQCDMGKHTRHCKHAESEMDLDSSSDEETVSQPSGSHTLYWSGSSRNSKKSSSFYRKEPLKGTSAGKSSKYSFKKQIRKTRSGMFDRPNQQVVRKLRWPHRFLEYEYCS